MKKCCKDPSLSDPGIFNDPDLLPFGSVIRSRLDAARSLCEKIKESHNGSLARFADYHEVFGLHFISGSWVFREWAPHADRIFILCDKTRWQEDPFFELVKKTDGVFEKKFPKETFSHQDLYRLKVVWPEGSGDRIPTAATRVVQDPDTLIFNAQVWHPTDSYQWRHGAPSDKGSPLLIYEAHVGMALEEQRVGTYLEFARHILPKIQHAGYSTVQLMAIMEHPYYASFGYHVSSFFAPSSRFGTPEELKFLIDTAHGMGIRVFIDVIHSHSVRNEVEGLSRFDGTRYQFFHDGGRGDHRLWDSRCFDYSRKQVLRFLLSNLRYWIDTFRVDGFRFDGVTSMLFQDHGIARAFTRYEDYFGPDVDQDALSYLFAANSLVHEINPRAVTIAEDVSGYPGLAAPAEMGGTGFDYRFSMGMADFWIRLLKEYKDEAWPMGTLWHELTTRRTEEKTISYAECHDQSLVGDKTLMMHLMDSRIYSDMDKSNRGIGTLRAVALHKMIRLVTLATAHSGYLNFMGNEFGHPEWVDFPCERNAFSFNHARRQWSLKYDPGLYYSDMFAFDRQMIVLCKNRDLFSSVHVSVLHIHEEDKILAFERKGLVFVFNFHPGKSFGDYRLSAPPGRYRMILDTDENRFGGLARLTPGQVHFTQAEKERHGIHNRLSLYLPSRSALVLEKTD